MSIRLKITLSFLTVGLLPFVIFSLFSIQSITNSIKERAQENLRLKADILLHEIQENVHNLDKLVKRWAKLQIMDDILVNDVDKRISVFLQEVYRDLGFEGYILCLDNEGKVVASSEATLIGRRIKLKTGGITDFESKKYLVLSSTVYASFSPEMVIGELITLFSLGNLERFLSRTPDSFTALINDSLGVKLNLPKGIFLNVKNSAGKFVSSGEYYIFAKGFSDRLMGKGWVLAAGVREDVIFGSVRKMSLVFGGSALSGGILIVLVSLFLSSRIVRSIEEVSDTMEYIVKTKDYTKRVKTEGTDELAKMSSSFNHMLSEIQKALRKLEEENLERLRLFKKLVEMFTLIVEQESEESLLKTAERELKEFLGAEVGLFTRPKGGWKSYKIEANVFKGDEFNRRVVAYLSLKTDNPSPELEKFLDSVAKLLSFQLDKLNMLKAQKVLRERAEQSSRAKSMFIANMSHELRTPLNAIIGFAQYLQTDPGLDEVHKEIAKNIEVSGRHLLSIINDILDFSKAEAGKITLSKERFNLASLLSEVEIMVKPSAEDKNIELHIDKPSIEVETDPKLLKQVLINLLSNAVKYTEEGSVSLKVERNDPYLKFRVIDTGIGISKEDQGRIFEAFEQVDNLLQKRHKGTGLGLALTRKLVKLLGGDIGVFSEGEGKGSEFWFTIPAG